MTIKKFILAAMAGLVGLIAATGAALAVPAEATTTVNVRTGPDTSFSPVDQLSPGERVDVVECRGGWCYVDQSESNGWVSATYLRAPRTGPDVPPRADDPECTFEFSIGPDGPSLSLNCPDGGSSPPPSSPPSSPPATSDIACMFMGPSQSGEQLCVGPSRFDTLSAAYNDNISSIRLYGDAKVRLCQNRNLGGFCRNVTSSEANLGGFLNNQVSSLVVYTGAPPASPSPPSPPSGPTTFSTGSITLQQTYTANLDNGNVGGGGVDIWYQAVNPVSKFITPRNGARLALGDGSNRGYAGCSSASYSSDRISIWAMPVGTYVCVRTDAGRVSQFRLNGYSGTTMNLGYTTWE